MKVETVYIADNIYKEDYAHCCVFVNGILEYDGGDYDDMGAIVCEGYVDCIKKSNNVAIDEDIIIIVNDNAYFSAEEIQKLYDEHSLVG